MRTSPLPPPKQAASEFRQSHGGRTRQCQWATKAVTLLTSVHPGTLLAWFFSSLPSCLCQVSQLANHLVVAQAAGSGELGGCAVLEVFFLSSFFFALLAFMTVDM